VKIVASSAAACNAPVKPRARKADTQRMLVESGGREVRQDYFGRRDNAHIKSLLSGYLEFGWVRRRGVEDRIPLGYGRLGGCPIRYHKDITWSTCLEQYKQLSKTYVLAVDV
jgi:hypothetical protein